MCVCATNNLIQHFNESLISPFFFFLWLLACDVDEEKKKKKERIWWLDDDDDVGLTRGHSIPTRPHTFDSTLYRLKRHLLLFRDMLNNKKKGKTRQWAPPCGKRLRDNLILKTCATLQRREEKEQTPCWCRLPCSFIAPSHHHHHFESGLQAGSSTVIIIIHSHNNNNIESQRWVISVVHLWEVNWAVKLLWCRFFFQTPWLTDLILFPPPVFFFFSRKEEDTYGIIINKYQRRLREREVKSFSQSRGVIDCLDLLSVGGGRREEEEEEIDCNQPK